MSLWTPPGADLGELDGPKPDERVNNFFWPDAHGDVKPVTYRRLKEYVDANWIITAATPDGPATLLKTAKEMFAHGFYCYEFVASSCSWSIFAVEAALKIRLGRQASFQELIKIAIEQRLWPPNVEEYLEAGREIRNNFVHEGKQPLWTFAMAREAIGSSFKLVAELYPEN